jgi:hypothetical protein
MTYQTAYKLLVAAYKSAKGIMPEGLDLLKIKQKARQKVIEVIQFPPDRITNPFKPRPTETEIMMKKTGIPVTVKGKTTTMTPDGILKMLMGKGKGKDVKIGQAPKTTKRKPAVDPKLTQEENIKRIMAENKAAAKPEKSLGEKLRDYDGDPDAMASGGKVKKPFRSKVVDFLGGPAVVEAELGLSGLLEVYNLLGMPLMRDGGKVKKKRKHNDNVDDEDIGEGESKKRFLNKMPRPRNYPNLPEEEIILDKMPRPKRSDGIMELATGGMTNISDTYDNNPTLQAQYPNKQDYLDMFAQQTTTTTPQTNTTTQSTTSTIAPINPIKPIIPLPQDSGDGGDKGLTTADQYGFGPYGNNFNTAAKQDEIDALNPGGVKGFMQGLGNFYKTVSPFLKAKKALAKGQDFALDIIQKAKEKELQRKINESIARESGSGSYQSQAAAHESKVGRSSGERMGRV